MLAIDVGVGGHVRGDCDEVGVGGGVEFAKQ